MDNTVVVLNVLLFQHYLNFSVGTELAIEVGMKILMPFGYI